MNSNYEQALKWYAKAADMGNAEAQYNMGKILIEEGEKYLRLSAKQGNKEAAALLGTMLSADRIHEPKIVASKTNAGNTGTGDCLVFESNEPFTIRAEERWDGIIEYSLDKIKWQGWDGKQITSKNNVIYMRGYGNTVITGAGRAENISWCFDRAAELICRGNLEAKLLSKGVRLDLYVEDEHGTAYDIEMQIDDRYKDYLGERTRYYQSMIDNDALKKGELYHKLRKSYIIFKICLSTI